MKYMIKKIIIGVVIGLILALLTGCNLVYAKDNIETKELAPNRIQLTWREGTNYGSYWGETQLAYFGNYKTYQTSFDFVGNAGLWKIAYEYNLSDVDADYISFYFYNTFYSAPFVALHGYPCEMITGQFSLYALNSSNNTTMLNGFNGYICRNPKKDNVFLDFGFGNSFLTPTNNYGTFNIGSAVTFYNDNTATTIQEINQELKEINNNIQETNNFLKDESLPNNSSGDISDLNSNIATNGTISSLVTMPITFLQKIVNGLNGSCTPIVIGELYDYNMTMPCIQPQQYIGIIWNIIDVICAGFLSFHFGKKLVSIFHKVTSMKDGGLEEAYD